MVRPGMAQPDDCLCHDPHRGQQQEPGLDERREVFDLPVTILMVGVGWFVRDSHRKQRDERRQQVKSGMGRLGENAQAGGARAHHDLQDGDQQCGKHRIESDGALLAAHHFGAQCLPGHNRDYIIAALRSQ